LYIIRRDSSREEVVAGDPQRSSSSSASPTISEYTSLTKEAAGDISFCGKGRFVTFVHVHVSMNR
jgi:hypothetical protein